MKLVENATIKRKFIKHFEGYESSGYSDLVEFIGDQVGFSLRRAYGPNDKQITLMKVALIDDAGYKSNVYIDATYGEFNESSQGLVIRGSDNIKLGDPIDIQEIGEFSYDMSKNIFTKKGKKISALTALNEVYSKHLKPTHKIRGFFLRAELWYWRIFLKSLVELIANIFTWNLIMIAGVRYQYDPLFAEERTNSIEHNAKNVENSGTESTINFFGYAVNKWTIVFYSSLHLILYFLFYTLDIHAKYMSAIFTNNFLTAIYVISSLWLIEFAIPLALKRGIKKLSDISLNLSFKKIEV